jgi:hypothetical protein
MPTRPTRDEQTRRELTEKRGADRAGVDREMHIGTAYADALVYAETVSGSGSGSDLL